MAALVAGQNKAEDTTAIMRGINKMHLAISDVCANSPVSAAGGHRCREVLLAHLSPTQGEAHPLSMVSPGSLH